MKIPEEISFTSLFECEPTMLDKDIPYFYNESTYRFCNGNSEKFIVRFCPSYGDINIQVYAESTNELMSNIVCANVVAIEILVDKKDESIIMITSENSAIKINFKPKFKIFINQFWS